MKNGKKYLGIALAVVIMGTFAVGAAMADSSSAANSASTPPNHPQFQQGQELAKLFLGNLATTLGVGEDTLTAALKTASTETVSQEVANGTITQDQADKILARISSGTLPIGIAGMGPGRSGSVAGSVYSDGRQGFRAGGGGFIALKPLADALGIDSKDLISDLKSGKTVSDLAAVKNLTVEQLQSEILTSVKAQLDQSVSGGKMTADQENQIYSKLEQSISSGDWIAQIQKFGQIKDRHQQPSAKQQAAQ